MISIHKYISDDAPRWDQVVRESRNGTFLHERAFMDYHADRFVDASLIFMKDSHAIAVFPATVNNTTVSSHAGLTYGGLIVTDKVHATEVLEMMDLVISYYTDYGYKKLVINPVPYIYYTNPSDDILYAIFRQGARIRACGLSTAIDLGAPLPLSALRRRGVKRAIKAGVTIEKIESEGEEYEAFWLMLCEVLQSRHSHNPVHTLHEIRLLASRFRHSIQLYVAKDHNGKVVAGTWVFITDRVVHTQYLAASSTGCDLGALDYLLCRMIERFKSSEARYLDFGISTENSGQELNIGLNRQKEGFGGRSVIYNSFEINL